MTDQMSWEQGLSGQGKKGWDLDSKSEGDEDWLGKKGGTGERNLRSGDWDCAGKETGTGTRSQGSERDRTGTGKVGGDRIEGIKHGGNGQKSMCPLGHTPPPEPGMEPRIPECLPFLSSQQTSERLTGKAFLSFLSNAGPHKG